MLPESNEENVSKPVLAASNSMLIYEDIHELP